MATQEPVGTLAEEAAKLISALQGWAMEHRSPNGPDAESSQDADADEYADSSGDAGADPDHGGGVGEDAEPGQYAEAHERGQHLSAECRYCPLCNVARIARAASPEVREHLTSAAVSMALAVKGLLDGLERQRHGGEPQREPVEKIDLMED